MTVHIMIVYDQIYAYKKVFKVYDTELKVVLLEND